MEENDLEDGLGRKLELVVLDRPHQTVIVFLNHRRIIEICKDTHDELAVEPVRQPAMARNGVTKVFNVEGALEAGGKEAAEGGDEAGEDSQDETVELEGCPPELRGQQSLDHFRRPLVRYRQP